MSILDSVSFCIKNVRPVLRKPTDKNYKTLFKTMYPNIRLDAKKLSKFKALINGLNKVTVDTETVGKNIQAMTQNVYKHALEKFKKKIYPSLNLPTENIGRANDLIKSFRKGY